MPPTKARKARDQAAKEQKAQEFLNFCAILAEDEEFLALISECTDSTTLNAYVYTRAQVTEYKEKMSEINAFTKVKTLLGSYNHQQLPTTIQNLQQSLKKHTSKSAQFRLRAEDGKNKTAK